MTQSIGVDILLALVFVILGAGGMWFFNLAERAASRERDSNTAAEISRMLRWLREKDERIAKMQSDGESLRVANAEWQTAAGVEKESRERERAAYESDRKRLEETFRAVGAQILDASTDKIMTMSQQLIEHQRLTATIEIEHILAPIGQAMAKVEEQIEAIEKGRAADRETLKAGLELLGSLLSSWRAGTHEPSSNGVSISRPDDLAFRREIEATSLPQIAPKAFESSSVADIAATLREYSNPAKRFIVRFRFRDAGDKTISDREVEPYGVFERSGTLSLIGYDIAYKAWRTFNIARFASKPAKAGRASTNRAVPEQYRFEDLDDGANGRQPDVTLALTLKEKDPILPRHADGGKSVNNPTAAVGR